MATKTAKGKRIETLPVDWSKHPKAWLFDSWLRRKHGEHYYSRIGRDILGPKRTDAGAFLPFWAEFIEEVG